MAGNMTGRLLNNRYRVGERVGIGGMAEVYRGQDNVLGRLVAIKVMLPQYAEDEAFAARFRQEAAAAANLQSPYIVNVYDWGQDQGTYYIVMEFVHGSDLKTAINQRGAINQRKVAEIGSQVCQALSVAHNLDIIHRDIKPQNIMVQPDGNVKVMDFGIARAKNSLKARTSAVLGTAHYISPEQAQGKELTAASDIYSLGVVMYEAATGQLPFDGPDAVSVAMKQVNEAPVPPREINPNIDPALEAIIMKAMSKNPADRFSTAVEMRRTLNDFLAGRPVNLPGVVPMGTTAVLPNNAGGYRPDTTSVLPVVNDSNRQNVNTRNQRNYLEDSKKKKKGKRTAIIIVCVIAAIALIAALAFALGGSGDTATVPDVTGKSLAEATSTLEDAGFKVGTVERVYSSTVADGNVVSQDPKAGTQQASGTKINLSVSQGTEQVEVPDLTNMTATEAKAALQKVGLNYEAGTAEYSDTIAENHVVRQSPAAGTKVSKDSTVTYYLSAGSEEVTVPDVVGMLEGTATTTLNNAGFKVSVDYTSSSTVSAGYVISQSPSGNSKATTDSTVNIVVSSGSETFSVYASASSGGSVYPTSVTVNSGDSVTFTATPNSGYTVSAVRDTSGNSYYVGSDGTFTISNVTSNMNITVVFSQTSSSSSGSGSGYNSSSSSG